MSSSSNKSKLKRDRALEAAPLKNELFPDREGAVIETRTASPEDPATRRFIPGFELNPAELKKSGVLDLRELAPGDGDFALEELVNHIICADAEAALKLLPDNSIAGIITSPPYWNVVDYGFPGQLGAGSYEDYLQQMLSVFRECERTLAPNGKLCINTPIMPISKKVISDQHTRHLKNLNNDLEAVILNNLSLQRFSLYIWQKQTTEKMFGSYPYPPNLYEQNTIEFINVLVKPGKPRQLPKAVKEKSRLSEKEWMDLTRQVWNLYPEDVKRAGHPAPFPESLPNRLIAMFTFAENKEEPIFPGDIVLDPFNGAGATCAAAKKLHRRFIGIDLSPHFCLAAKRRLEKTFPDGKIHLHPEKTNSSRAESPCAGDLICLMEGGGQSL